METEKNKGVTILDAGKGWLAVEKPSDMSVHNTPGKDLLSILSSMAKRDQTLANKLCADPGFGLHPAHRLDAETSGIILFACRKEVLSHLGKQFESGQTQKRYTALVHGLFEEKDKNGWQTWNYPLTKASGGRTDPAGKGKRVQCGTRFRVMDESQHHTLLEIELLTGRKHQIRRHAKLSGHPVAGDRRYGSPRSIKFLEEKRDFHRLALHAYSLTVTLPENEKPVTFSTPRVPHKIMEILDSDR